MLAASVPSLACLAMITTLAASSARADSFPEGEAPVPVLKSDPRVGSDAAPLTLVIFGNYREPFTRSFWGGLAKLRKRFGADLRIVMKDKQLSHIVQGPLAAQAAHGVYARHGSAAWQAFAELVMPFTGAVDAKVLGGFAAIAGVKDRARFEADLAAGTWANEIDASDALGERLKVVGVPGSFLNGIRISGAQKVDTLLPVFEAELAEARAWRARKISARDIYGVRTQANFGRAVEIRQGRAQVVADASAPAPAPAPLAGAPEPVEVQRPKDLVVVVKGVAIGPIMLGRFLDRALAAGAQKESGGGGKYYCVPHDNGQKGCAYRFRVEDDKIVWMSYQISRSGVDIQFPGKVFRAGDRAEEMAKYLGCDTWQFGSDDPVATAKCPGRIELMRRCSFMPDGDCAAPWETRIDMQF